MNMLACLTLFSNSLAHFPHLFTSLSPAFFPTSIFASIKPLRRLNILEGLRTFYLFTKSDFKTIVLPVTIFAVIMAPNTHITRLPRVIFWIWLHLLQFCISNQSINPEEDSINKPWRPVPAGRITVAQARKVRWFIVAFCLVLSTTRGLLPASVLVCLVTYVYNDLSFHEHTVMRNLCNAIGYASFELGATQLAGDQIVDVSALVSLTASALIVFTTIHAADFRDEKGDRIEGKQTLPILYPEASRFSMLTSLPAWSVVLGMFWNIDAVLALVLLAVGALVGCRFMWKRDITADRNSYLLYNVWLSLVHISLGMGPNHDWAIVSQARTHLN